jgi:long-chain acyl-CoA synthetase
MARDPLTNVVLLTGATGFLGTHLALRLLKEEGTAIIALVRARDAETARQRLLRLWWDWPELVDAVGGRVTVLAGDVALPRLGLDETRQEALTKKVTHVIHAAAAVRMDIPVGELRKTNVQGTVNVLELATAAHKDHGLARFSHTSTAYVAGGRKGEVREDSLTDEFGFSSAYEMTKYEAELLVNEAKKDLPVSVLRPGMVVGDSRTGAVKAFNTLYVPLRLYLSGRLRIFPTSGSLRVNLAPVDYVADAVVRLTFDRRAEGLNFHLTAPSSSLPTVKQMMHLVREWAETHLGMKLPRPLFIPLPLHLAKAGPRDRKAIEGEDRRTAGALELLAPYFKEDRIFRRDNTDRLLGPYVLKWQSVLPTLLQYAVYHGFLHRSERTIHEQVLFRLESKSRPVTYHDIVDGKAIIRSAAEVHREMLAVVGALAFLGIRAGDRVAIVGLNNTRYLALDVAIGLAGAVSVHLYYTSPPDEIDGILVASGARVLFVGAPKVMERLGEIRTDVKVVSFCRQPPPANLPREVIAWEDFLEQGKGKECQAEAPLGFGDIATLRYTSGTTGRPKGVVFRHGNLRFMAESTISLMPWKARTSPIFYVSFLPLNHVVEGILSTYSLYYALAPVDVYYLEDFRELHFALPLVRPSVFFAVPRVYEKLWQGLLATRLGRSFAASQPGLKKRFLARLLRAPLLRKAGLDRCAQLIVGSAPASEKLLRDFRELGIEIHNAYGLSEAPLVTFNRRGANRIGTVGQPLPCTEVKIADDGEILVRGPQVTPGYFEKDAVPPFRDGWLVTGDVGRMEDGFLIIEGRRKEIIATSYGKKIHPCGIEEMLKGIPGVAEAMLVGEKQPYCTAILWVKGDWSPESASEIGRAIDAINSRLSHPEQIRRWAVMAHDLSPEGGELTATFKLRRQEVARLRPEVILALYDEGDVPKSVLYLGGRTTWA